MTLIMHRTRNRGVIGVNGWRTQGPAINAGAVTPPTPFKPAPEVKKEKKPK